VQGGLEILHRSLQLGRPPRIGHRARRAQALERACQRHAFGIQQLAAGRRDGVLLLAGRLVCNGGLAQFLEQRQRGVDDPGARAVFATGQFLDRLDDLVSVARLLVQQVEHHQLQPALLEHALAATAAVHALAHLIPAAAPVVASGSVVVTTTLVSSKQ